MSDRALDDFVARARSLRQRELLDTAALAALRAFKSAGIDAMVLKGPALARLLYAGGETRGYSDVDLLIPRGSLPTARETLRQLGYANANEIFGIDDVAGVLHSELWSRPGERAIRSGPIMIDLHWRLDGCRAADDVLWEALWARRGSIELCGEEAAALGDEALALHVALHAAQHGPSDTKAIGDLTRAVERWPVDLWRRAAQLAETLRGVRAFAAGLRLVPAGRRLASELGLPETAELDWRIRTREDRPRGTFHVEAWRDARGLRQRANVLRRSLFPTRQWIRYYLPWAARGSAWMVLGYAWHIVRAPLWAARAARYLVKARRAGERG
jgi:hypothetical protein